MFTSRPLQVLLLLACSVTAVPAKEPSAVFGAGVTLCKVYVEAVKDPNGKPLAETVLSWVQGYFSARNVGGRLTHPEEHRLTVGGTMSLETLQAMLVDQCNDEDFRAGPAFFAAEALYNKLQAKGL